MKGFQWDLWLPMLTSDDTCSNDDGVEQGGFASGAKCGEDLRCIEHDGIDAGQLLNNGNDKGDDQLWAVARLQQGSQGMLDGIGLSGLNDDVLELHLNILLPTNLLQNLHDASSLNQRHVWDQRGSLQALQCTQKDLRVHCHHMLVQTREGSV